MSTRFIVGLPARDDAFYGRAADVEAILQQPWNWLCGQRRMGKTSVLFRIQHEAARRGFVPLFMNLSSLSENEANGRALLQQFLESAEGTLLALGVSLDDLERRPPHEAMVEIVNRVLRQQPRSRVVLLWDEAERLLDVERGDNGFLERLRGALEPIQQLSFIVAGTQLLSSLFGQQGHCSPFLTAFRWRPIGPLQPADARALLFAERTGGWNTPPASALVEEMIAWTGGHPYVLQEVGSLIEERQWTGSAPMSVQELKASILGNQGLKLSFVDDFVKLTITQQEVLMALSRGGSTATGEDLTRSTDRSLDQIREACEFLTNYGYVRGSDPYSLRFVFYPRFVHQGHSAAEPQKVSRIVRQTLFISYSHKDAVWLAQVRKFLGPAVTAGEIEAWSDEDIAPGKLWRDEIERALASARVALLLVSQDFITSKFIREVELPEILAQATHGAARVLCLHLSRSTLSAVIPAGAHQLQKLATFQALNKPTLPLAELAPTALDGELVRVAGLICNTTP